MGCKIHIQRGRKQRSISRDYSQRNEIDGWLEWRMRFGIRLEEHESKVGIAKRVSPLRWSLAHINLVPKAWFVRRALLYQKYCRVIVGQNLVSGDALHTASRMMHNGISSATYLILSQIVTEHSHFVYQCKSGRNVRTAFSPTITCILPESKYARAISFVSTSFSGRICTRSKSTFPSLLYLAVAQQCFELPINISIWTGVGSSRLCCASPLSDE